MVGFLVFCIIVAAIIPRGSTLSVDDLYTDLNGDGDKLPHGDDKYEFVKLATPIHFYSETYDHIYINTNGILTFGAEFPQFVNQPFPLEYPSIAPFYTNVDTTDANETTTISYFKSHNADLLTRVSELVASAFSDANDFEAQSLFVATWENVGHFAGENKLQNTFQVAIICSSEETYIQFLYPTGGLNWVQGVIGESGLPDVRAQAGFVSEDTRFFSLKGSGTDNAKYLNEMSNYGEPGSWLFRIGPIGFTDEAEEPDVLPDQDESRVNYASCNSEGKLKCHSSATCQDTRRGFCCTCLEGYYGNGFSCLKNNVPVRVSGKVSGTIRGSTIESQLQSYVVMTDGRSYTAISPLSADVGFNLQLVQVLGGAIGWLFAKPIGDVHNGYQITGGKFNHTSRIHFEETGEQFEVVQVFQGLNVWDQLSVDIKLSGNLPETNIGTNVSMDDIAEEYNYSTETSLRSVGTRRITVDDRVIVFSIDQEIDFEKCEFAEPKDIVNHPPVFNKVSKILAGYQQHEGALRIGMLNKISLDVQSNPCNDGTALCGENTVCVPEGDDGFECQCKNGFTPVFNENNVQTCLDIDECAGTNICDVHADCHNKLGGYTCRCQDGYIGNGNTCQSNEETSESLKVSPTPYVPSLAPEHWLCDQCSQNAQCFQGQCVCNNGWTGDGMECNYNCPAEFVWSVDRCTPVAASEEDESEIAPFCHQQGCTCPTGYVLVEYTIGPSCRLIVHDEDETRRSDEELLPCDVENNCSQSATCEWVEAELRNKCVCMTGFEGDGYECLEKETSCLHADICDVHASCSYDDIFGKSICKCDKGYEGNGRLCQLAPECEISEHCTANSLCDNGICLCQHGFERDLSDFCVPAGSCGGAFCAENAVCQWDNIEKVSYCHCPAEFVGDGVKTCKSIPPPCNVRNNCGLYASCSPNYRDTSVYECVCDVGYYGDGFVCLLEVNCVNVPSLCSPNAQCQSTTSGLQCVCNSGFIGNGSICSEPPRHDSGFLLLSQGVATVRIPFDGKRGRPVAMSSMAIGLDKDCANGRVYWSDITSKNIKSAKYDGTDVQTFITDDIISPEGVAIDWISRRLYWTDSTKDTIEVASLDDPTLRTVVIRKHLVNPRGIAVDPHQNKIYWSDWNRDGPKIEWSNLDGTDRQILVAEPSVKLPNSLAILQKTAELCFADAGTKKIECVDTYSKSLRTIAGNLSYPFGLAVTDEQFYWTDWTTKKIESIDLNGNRLAAIASPLFGNHKMYGMTAVTDNCPLFYSPCQINNGDCPEERLCLVNSNIRSGRTCKCVNASTNCNEINEDD